MKNKIVLYTAIAGGYDNLILHKHKSDRFDYVCYSDREITNPGHWQIRTMDVFVSRDNVRNAKYYKVFPDLLFPDYEYSVWIDANIDVLDDDLETRILELCESNIKISANIHAKSSCAYQEAYVCIKAGKDDPELIINEMDFIRSEGFPEKWGLFEMNMIFRAHHDPAVKKLMLDWWDMIQKFSRRDQLSFPFVLYKNKMSCEQLFPFNARFRNGFYFREHGKRVVSSVFVDSGNGFSPSDFAMKLVAIDDISLYSIAFDLSKYKKIESLRIEPLFGSACRMSIDKIVIENNDGIRNIDSKLLKKYIKTNGQLKKNGMIFFKTLDPYLFLTLPVKNIDMLTIRGVLKTIGLEEIISPSLNLKTKKIIKKILPSPVLNRVRQLWWNFRKDRAIGR